MPEFKGRGFKLHYVEQGDGPPIVFLPALVFDHTMFVAQFEDLPDKYRCLALDPRGHGHSETPPGPWSLQDCVDDAIAFIEDVAGGPSHVVGSSWGGMMALRLAVQRQDLVQSLVLIGTTATEMPEDAVGIYRGFQEAVREQGPTEELAAMATAMFFSEDFRTAQPEAVGYQTDRITTMKREAIVEGLRSAMDRDSVVDSLPRITVPTLVIQGELDASVPMARAEELATQIPRAELVRVPNVSHLVPIEAPDAVNIALAEFFARVS